MITAIAVLHSISTVICTYDTTNTANLLDLTENDEQMFSKLGIQRPKTVDEAVLIIRWLHDKTDYLQKHNLIVEEDVRILRENNRLLYRYDNNDWLYEKISRLHDERDTMRTYIKLQRKIETFERSRRKKKNQNEKSPEIHRKQIWIAVFRDADKPGEWNRVTGLSDILRSLGFLVAEEKARIMCEFYASLDDLFRSYARTGFYGPGFLDDEVYGRVADGVLHL